MVFSLKKISLISSMFLLSASSLIGSTDLQKVMKDRGLSERDVLAAAKTYTPTGMKDEYYVFSSDNKTSNIKLSPTSNMF